MGVLHVTEIQIVLVTHPATPCAVPCRQYASAVYDWLDTDRRSLHVNIRVNDSNAAQNSLGGIPVVQRWSAAMNLATNAFLNISKVRSACGISEMVRL